MDALMFASSIFVILMMAYSFALRKSLAEKVSVICGSILLLLSLVGMVSPLLRHRIDAVFGVVCFIWIAVCVATSYAFYELRRQLFSCNENATSLPALMGASAVLILGIVACLCLVEWICA